jgi:predicted short-subunit dehydrogenase-like oxidoreductase (DUF2520 family)
MLTSSSVFVKRVVVFAAIVRACHTDCLVALPRRCYSAPGMARRKNFSIVGAGRLGSALAVALHTAGETVSEIVVRDGSASVARAKSLARTVGARIFTEPAQSTADVVWICVADGNIADVAAGMARNGDWKGRVVFHSSGALSSDELAPLRRRGASVASVHPMMSFVRGVKPALEGVTFALEGDEAALRSARSVVRKWKARAIQIRKRDKALYHAWGAFLSPLIVAELATSEKVAAAVGVSPAEARKVMAPILRQTIENYLRHGAAAAFSGPIVRGDTETIRRHVRALRRISPANDVYRALVRAALELLPAGNRAKTKAVLK